MAGCREPEGSLSDKQGLCTCVDVSVRVGAGWPYLPKQIPREGNRPGRDGSLTVLWSSLPGCCYDSRRLASSQSPLPPGHLASSGAVVQLQLGFCLLRIRKERRPWSPVVTTLLWCWHPCRWWCVSMVPCSPGVGEPVPLSDHCGSFWGGVKMGRISEFGTVDVRGG